MGCRDDPIAQQASCQLFVGDELPEPPARCHREATLRIGNERAEDHRDVIAVAGPPVEKTGLLEVRTKITTETQRHGEESELRRVHPDTLFILPPPPPLK